jgi:DNA mismatch repair protein MutS
VARLAGLPPQVIARAQTLLAEMEAGGHGVIDAERLAAELPLFTHDFTTAPVPAEDPVRARIEAINPDMLAPREALELVYELRDLLRAPADDTEG